MLEIVHGAGYIYNDISLDKINLGQKQRIDKEFTSDDTENQLEGKSLNLQDFTYTTPYIDFETGKHLKQEKVNCSFHISN